MSAEIICNISTDVLSSGDLISLHSGNGLGFLSSSSFESEPGFVSMSRPLPLQYVKSIDHDDFHRRCLFRIEPVDFAHEKGTELIIKFGSIIQLFSYPEGFILCGNKSRQGNCNNIDLKKIDNISSSYLDAQWIVESKYKLRQNNDSVKDGDFVILKNVNNSDLKLVLGDDHHISVAQQADISWSITIHKKMQHGNNDMRFMLGDYIKLRHIEVAADLMARPSDESTNQLRHVRMGLLSREALLPTSCHRMKPFLRPTPSPESFPDGEFIDDNSCGVVGLNIWRILPLSNKSKLTAVTSSTSFLLRHLLSGLYLSIVDQNEEGVSYTGSSLCLTRDRNKSCELCFEPVDKDNSSNPLAISNQPVLLRHADCTSGIYFRAVCSVTNDHFSAQPQSSRLQSPQEVKAVNMNGAWETLDDISVDTMTHSHISEALRLRSVGLEEVREVLVVLRLAPLLFTVLSLLQLGDQKLISKVDASALLHTFSARISAFTLWLQARDESVLLSEASLSQVLDPHNTVQAPTSTVQPILLKLLRGINKEGGVEVADDGEYDDDDDDNDDKDSFSKNLPTWLRQCLSKNKSMVEETKSERAHFGLLSDDQKYIYRRRQLILSNSRFTDLLIHLSNVLFLHSIVAARQEKEAKGDLRTSRPTSITSRSHYSVAEDDQNKILVDTSMINECLPSLLQTIGDSFNQNTAVSMKFLSCRDLFTSWLHMTKYGWKPPLQCVALVSESYSQKLCSDGLTQHDLIDPAEVYAAVAHAVGQQRAGNVDLATQCLDCISCLFSASGSFKTRQLDSVVYLIFQLFVYDSAQLNDGSESRQSLWFRLMNVRGEFRILSECGEVQELFTRLLFSNLEDEIKSIIAASQEYLIDDKLPIEKAVELVEDLGLSSLCARTCLSESLVNKTLRDIVLWWWQFNPSYFPSQLTYLSHASKKDVEQVLDRLNVPTVVQQSDAELQNVLDLYYIDNRFKGRIASLNRKSFFLDSSTQSSLAFLSSLRFANSGYDVFSGDSDHDADDEGDLFHDEVFQVRKQILEYEENKATVVVSDSFLPSFRRSTDFQNEDEDQGLAAESESDMGQESNADDDHDNDNDNVGYPPRSRFDNPLFYSESSYRILGEDNMTTHIYQPPSLLDGIPSETLAEIPDGSITWVKLFSKSSIDGAKWLRQSVSNINALCDPKNPLVQKLVSLLLPPDLLIGLLESRDVRLRYKTILMEILCKTYFRRNGVFSSFVMTSGTENFYLGLDYNVKAADEVTHISDVFNDIASPFSFERGAALRKTLSEYLILSLQLMSLSISKNVSIMKYNAAQLCLMKEMLQRGFFIPSSGTKAILFGAIPPHKPSPQKYRYIPLRNRQQETQEAMPIQPRKSVLSVDSPYDIQKLVRKRLAAMSPPRETDRNYDAALVASSYVAMMDAIVDVLFETSEMINLERLEMFVRLSGAEGEVATMPNHANKDQKLTKALMYVFAGTPHYLGNNIEYVSQKAHSMLYNQINQGNIAFQTLKRLRLFPSTVTALKTRQLAGLAAHVKNNLIYIRDKLTSNEDDLLKAYMFDEIRLLFSNIGTICASFSFISDVDLDNNDSQMPMDNVEHDPAWVANEITTLIDIEHFSQYGHFPVDSYVEVYFLRDFCLELSKLILQWGRDWENLTSRDHEVVNTVLEFLACCCRSSRSLSHAVFASMKALVIVHWRSYVAASLLLEQFAYHKCSFENDEVLELLSHLLDEIKVSDLAANSPASSVEPLKIVSDKGYHFLPLLTSLIDMVYLVDDVSQSNGHDDLSESVIEVATLQGDVADKLLFLLDSLSSQVGDVVSNDHSEEDRSVDLRSPLFLFTIRALVAFVSNLNISESLRVELKMRIQEVWPVDFIGILVRQRDCPGNSRILLLKLYISVFQFDDFDLLDRCLIKQIDSSRSFQHQKNKSFVESLRSTPVLGHASSAVSQPARRSSIEPGLNRWLPANMPSVPVFIDYLDDCVYVVGKVVVNHWHRMYRPSERQVAVNARIEETDEFVISASKQFQNIRALTSAVSLSFAYNPDPFRESILLYRVQETLVDVERDHDFANSLPAIFAIVTLCEFLQKYCNTNSGMSGHIHQTAAHHLMWVCAFTCLMIDDLQAHEYKLTNTQLESALESRRRLRHAMDVFFEWRRQSCQYNGVLAISSEAFEQRYLSRRDKSAVSLKLNEPNRSFVDNLYLQEVILGQTSFLFKELNRIITKLSLLLSSYTGDVASMREASLSTNKKILSTPEALSIINLFEYFGEYATPDQSTYTLFMVLNSFFRSFDAKLSLSEARINITSLRVLQCVFEKVGAVSMAAKLIVRFMDLYNKMDEGNRENDPQASLIIQIVSAAIHFSCNLLHEGNEEVQKSFLAVIGYDIKSHLFSIRGSNLMVSLSHVINSNITNSTELDISLEQLEVIGRVFRFCSVLTSRSDDVQKYVRNQNQFENVNMIAVVSSTIEFLSRYFQIKMVKNEKHNQSIVLSTSTTSTPFIWEQDSHKTVNQSLLLNDQRPIESIIQVLEVISAGCVALKNMCQGPCILNQLSANAALNGLPDLLSVIGVFLSHEKKTTVESLLFGPKSDPLYSEEYNTFLRSKLLLRVAKTLEIDIMRVLIALLEGSSQERILDIGAKFNESVLFFNLDRVYKNMNRSGYRDQISSRTAAVAYLSSLLTIADAQEIFQGISVRTKNIVSWQNKCSREGRNTSEFLISVEVIDKNGNIDRKYFPKPDFVKNYWNYPEVATAKDQVMHEVLRTSPEEKMTDFFAQLHRLESIMGRQQLLRNTLTPPVHTLLGGQTSIPLYIRRLTPSQRQFLLILTFYLNAVYVLYSFSPSLDDEMHGRTGPINFFSNEVWGDFFTTINQPLAVFLVRVIHFLLAGIQVIRKAFNSRVLDSSVDTNVEMSTQKMSMSLLLFSRIMKNIILSPKTLLLLLFDIWWTIFLFVFSSLGIYYNIGWYVPCVLDVIPQIKYMAFLVDAVRDNALRIFLTIFLFLILLYVYAVITYLFLPDQYGFNGHYACNKDVLSCFKLHIDYGLNNQMSWNDNGDLGYIDPMFTPSNRIRDPYWADLLSKIFGTIYSLIYLVLVNLVLVAIITGYIVDSFASMREKNESIEKDMRSQCFICSISRDQFEQAGLSFEKV